MHRKVGRFMRGNVTYIYSLSFSERQNKMPRCKSRSKVSFGLYYPQSNEGLDVERKASQQCVRSMRRRGKRKWNKKSGGNSQLYLKNEWARWAYDFNLSFSSLPLETPCVNDPRRDLTTPSNEAQAQGKAHPLVHRMSPRSPSPSEFNGRLQARGSVSPAFQNCSRTLGF